MAWGTIDDDQFEEFANRIKSKLDNESFKEEILKSSRRVRTATIANVKSLTPVDSGHLRRTWHVSNPYFNGTSILIEVYNNAEYASYVENGHRQEPGRYVPAIGKRLKASWVPGQHMLMSTLFKIDEQMPELLSSGLKSALEDLFQ